jgi:hypothetical protein
MTMAKSISPSCPGPWRRTATSSAAPWPECLPGSSTSLKNRLLGEIRILTFCKPCGAVSGRQESPTHGGPDHREESIRFCRAFPDNKVHHPYYVLFGEGDFTCFITHFTETFTAPLEMPDGTAI